MAKNDKKQEESKNEVVVFRTVEAVVNPKIPFDSWFYSKKDKIPAQHKMEVIKADFLARGITTNELPDTFDKALELYGVKIN